MENIEINFNPERDGLYNILFNGEESDAIDKFLAEKMADISAKVSAGEELCEDEKRILATVYTSMLDIDTIISITDIMLPSIDFNHMGEFVDYLSTIADRDIIKKMLGYISYKLSNEEEK